MKITGLSHLFKWENLHNWWLTKYFFAPLYILTDAAAETGQLTVVISHIGNSYYIYTFVRLCGILHNCRSLMLKFRP